RRFSPILRSGSSIPVRMTTADTWRLGRSGRRWRTSGSKRGRASLCNLPRPPGSSAPIAPRARGPSRFTLLRQCCSACKTPLLHSAAWAASARKSLRASKRPSRRREDIMYRTEVGIIGGGLAGSLAAAMLGRRGIDCVLIDPHQTYPDDFRCEKLDGPQMAILRKTGLAEAVLRASTPDRESWVARFGRVVEKRDGDQQGIFYTSLVNTIRAQIPANVRCILAKAASIENDGEMRRVVLSNGECVEARLIVLANGLNLSLRDRLGLQREIVSPCHSITVGFNMRPVGRQAFEFPALTAYAEDPRQRAALITMFP